MNWDMIITVGIVLAAALWLGWRFVHSSGGCGCGCSSGGNGSSCGCAGGSENIPGGSASSGCCCGGSGGGQGGCRK